MCGWQQRQPHTRKEPIMKAKFYLLQNINTNLPAAQRSKKRFFLARDCKTASDAIVDGAKFYTLKAAKAAAADLGNKYSVITREQALEINQKNQKVAA